LTYHKIGPRPWRVRLKGLYLSQRLFSRQLDELARAGFASASLDQAVAALQAQHHPPRGGAACCGPTSNSIPVGDKRRAASGRQHAVPPQKSAPLPITPDSRAEFEATVEQPGPHEQPQTELPGARARQIVFTFDDGFLNVSRYAIKPLAEHRFTAIQFLVADLLGQRNQWDIHQGEAGEPLMSLTEIREWLAAGHQIGSHTLTHPFLTRLPTAAAREEITASKKKLEDLFGLPIRHFCYPYGDWNPSVRDLVAEAGYATACTTEFGVNPPDTSPFALRRITARYPTRSLKGLLRPLMVRFRRK
jgi:peptidoglycan/xylan/chitin deacetylase (PgdA/CDA1 family)